MTIVRSVTQVVVRGERSTAHMPKGSQIMKMDFNGGVVLTILCDPAQPMEERFFRIVWAGQSAVFGDAEPTHIGSFLMKGQFDIEGHVFETFGPPPMNIVEEHEHAARHIRQAHAAPKPAHPRCPVCNDDSSQCPNNYSGGNVGAPCPF